MRGLSLMTGLVVGLLLLGFVAAGPPPLAAEPDPAAVTGGSLGLGNCVVDADHPCPLVLRNEPCAQSECTGTTCPAGAKGYQRLNFTYKGTTGAASGSVGAVPILGSRVTCQLYGPCASAGQTGGMACSAVQPNGKRYCLGGFNLLLVDRYQVDETTAGPDPCPAGGTTP